MTVVLLTGMSGAGTSTVLAELARRGHRVVDTDDPGWIEEVPLPGGGPPEPMWRVDRMTALLDGHTSGLLVVAGCVVNQGDFTPRFDAVVLLTAPLDVLLARVRSRSNPFGRTTAERARIAADVAEVEPLLRSSATLVVDTDRATVDEVADLVERTPTLAPPARDV